MQRVNIYNDLLHLTGEWMNADMLNTAPPLSLSFLGGGGERPLRPPLDPPLVFSVREKK
jgi:hypothetical protein